MASLIAATLMISGCVNPFAKQPSEAEVNFALQQQMAASGAQPKVAAEPKAAASAEVAVEDLDTDRDGLPDAEEVKLGTDPQRADSDDDGYKDGAEIQKGYNPIGPGLIPESIKQEYQSWLPVKQATDTKYISELRAAASVLEQYYGDNMTYGGSEPVDTWNKLVALVTPTVGHLYEAQPGDFSAFRVAITSGAHVNSYCMWTDSQVEAGKYIICTQGANCSKGVSKADAEAKGCKN